MGDKININVSFCKTIFAKERRYEFTRLVSSPLPFHPIPFNGI